MADKASLKWKAATCSYKSKMLVGLAGSFFKSIISIDKQCLLGPSNLIGQ